MDPLGFEPRASSLQRRHSTAELWAHPLSGTRSLALIVQRCPIGRLGGRSNADGAERAWSARSAERVARCATVWWAGASPRSRSVEVIQPQIPLRLPCYDLIPLAKPRFDRRMTASSRSHSGDLTGGVCKEQGRIHRALLRRDYYRIQLHEGEFQPSIRTTTEFRRLAPPFGVASHCLGHCSPRVAQHIRGILTYRCPFLPPVWHWQSS